MNEIERCGGIEMNWKESKVMGISRQQSPIQVMTDKKEPENVEYNNYSGSMVAKDASCTCTFRAAEENIPQTTKVLRSRFR